MIRKNSYPFIIAFLLLAVVVVINQESFSKIKLHARWVDHTYTVISTFEQLSNDLKSTEIYSESFKDSEVSYYNLYLKEAKNVFADLEELHKLVKDNTRQARAVD